MSKINTLKSALEFKDKFEIRFQLDNSRQRIFMAISDREICEKLEMREVSFGSFYLELFSNEEDRNFDLFDHIMFLTNIQNYCLKPSYNSYNGRTEDAGIGLLVLLQIEGGLEKLNDAIIGEINNLRIIALNRIGGYLKDIKKENFTDYLANLEKYHRKKIEDLERELSEYVSDSETYKRILEKIKEEKLFYELLIGLVGDEVATYCENCNK